MLRKYHKQLFFLTITALFCVGCGFPYNTPEARHARRTLRLQRQLAKRQVHTVQDTAAVIATGKMNTNSMVIADTTNIEQPDTINSGQPDRITIVRSDSSGLDKLNQQLSFIDSLGQGITLDSLNAIALNDSTGLDSIAQATRMKASIARQVRYSKDSLDKPVQYESADSMIYDLLTRKVYLYHNAQVFYEQYSLKAGYIEFNFLTNVATATCLVDSAGNEVECPIFNDGTQEFTSRRIEFNFKSKKGKVYDASTQQDDGYLVSDATKFISSDVDTFGSQPQSILYSQGCLYTTCDAPHPHFGIRASKAKIIPGKLIVVGPSFLEIMGSPTPIILPFGFFPITKNKRSGLILSMDVDFSPQIGPGIRGIGFYWGESEFFDLKVTGDFYMRGSVRARAESQYNIRYKSSGKVTLSYTRIQQDYRGSTLYSLQQSFNIQWQHRQAAQAHPSQSFSAMVDFGTGTFYQNTFNDAESVLKPSFSSNIGYTKRFLGSPFTLTIRASHTQNTQTRIMTINAPQATLNMTQIFPFKRKKVSGKTRWYENIGFSYRVSANNRMTTTDTALFKPGGLQDALSNMEYRISHAPSVRLGIKLFEALNIEPGITYGQNWFFYRKRQELNTAPILNPNDVTDTTSYGTVETIRDYGFFTTHNFSANLGINTRIFATGFFNMGALRQVRATFTPSVTATWTPGYENAYAYYYDTVQIDTRYPARQRRYSYFDGVNPPLETTARLTYSLDTRLDAKIRRSKRDTTSEDPIKKVALFPALNFRGNYNITADSNHLSPINFNANTTLFKKLTLTFNATFDPYAANPENNQRIADWEFDRTGRIVRTTQMQFNASTGLSSRDLKAIFEPKNNNSEGTSGFDFLQSMRIQYNLVVNNLYINGVDSSILTTHQVGLRGEINLSKGWGISIGNIGYSFKDQRITFPDFRFRRDLHCWQMELSWQPERQTWSFHIKAKSGTLGFLKVPVKREFYDTF